MTASKICYIYSVFYRTNEKRGASDKADIHAIIHIATRYAQF